MAITTKFDFFRVYMPENTTRTFEQIVAEIAGIQDRRQRNITLNQSPVRLQECTDSPEQIEGDMVRIRMNDLPTRASLQGEVNNLELTEDEGAGEHTAFLYFKAWKVLVLQRNRPGVTASSFVDYFEQKSNAIPITVQPVLRLDTMQKLNSLQTISALDVTVAPLQNAQIFRDQGNTLKQMLGICEDLRAPRLHLKASIGKQRTSLNVEAVKDAILKFLRIRANTEQVKKLCVSGKYDDRVGETLDLLKHSMCESRDIEEDEHRKLSYADRISAVKSVFNLKRQELGQMFNEPGA